MRIPRPPLRDSATAAAVTVVILAASYAEAHPTQPNRYFSVGHQLPHTPVAAFLLVLVAGLVLAWRYRYPRTVLSISTAAVVVYSLLGYVNGAALLLPAVAMWAFATSAPIRHAVTWAIAVTLILMGATAANNPFGPIGGGWVMIPADIAVALFGGIAIGSRRAYVAAQREEAEREARRQIDEERLRIARELHDVVAHTMATINVQASAAAQLLSDRPEKAADSLAAIRIASKDGLRELRAILNVLRHADESADPTRPTPGLARLDALAAGVRQAGLPVTVTVSGQPRPLPAVTDLAAFRIIQEALTNSIRHAGPASAAVSVRYGSADLWIEVTDTGRGSRASGTGASPVDSSGSGPGHGLRGMRERAAAAGGMIEIGPRSSGGFRVAARFPLAAASVPGPAPSVTTPASVPAGPAASSPGTPTPADSNVPTSQKVRR
ncbi:MAG TPA: sensor histidine kinase [Streptosporangiaceae bacterium]